MSCPPVLQGFADCLTANATLKHLSLGPDKLGDEAVRVLCAGLAQRLVGAAALGPGVQVGVCGWRLSGCGAAQLEQLKTNKSLTTMSLSSNQIGDQGVGKLAKGLSENTDSGVKELHVTEAGISGAGLDHLAALVEQESCSLTTMQLSLAYRALSATEAADCLYTSAAKYCEAFLMEA